MKQKGDELVVELDPGMAFGTGDHELLKCVCKLLKKYVKEDTVVDLM